MLRQQLDLVKVEQNRNRQNKNAHKKRNASNIESAGEVQGNGLSSEDLCDQHARIDDRQSTREDDEVERVVEIQGTEAT